MKIKEISVEELKQWRDEGRDFILLDVRNPDELEVCQIEGHVHIPMGEVSERFSELKQGKPIAVMCHHGKRGAKVCEYLANQGFKDIYNVAGGIHKWSINIDPSVQTY